MKIEVTLTPSVVLVLTQRYVRFRTQDAHARFGSTKRKVTGARVSRREKSGRKISSGRVEFRANAPVTPVSLAEMRRTRRRRGREDRGRARRKKEYVTVLEHLAHGVVFRGLVGIINCFISALIRASPFARLSKYRGRNPHGDV